MSTGRERRDTKRGRERDGNLCIIMQKMSYFSAPLFLCLDVCVVHAIRLAQLSPLLLSHPFITLWGGGLTRACLLALFIFTCPGSLPWMSSFEGLQSLGVLCFHFPVYTALLWALEQSTMEEVWGWHSWERVLQGYVVTMVAWLYWSRYVSSLLLSWGRYVSSLLLSWGRYISSLLTRAPSDKPKEVANSSLEKLMGFMLPYRWRFVLVLFLVVLSSYGEMAIPQYTGRVADWIINEEAPDAFTEAITVMTLMTIASAVLEFVCDLMYNVTMSLIHTSVQGAVFQAVLKQEIAFFDATPTGELVSRVTTDTNDMSEALSEKLSLVMWYTARFGFLMYFMVSQSWKMSLLTCMGLPIIWVVPKLIGHFQQTIAVKLQESLAKANQVATETFSCMKTVRSFANEDGETEKYRRRLEDTYALNKKEAVAYAASTWANSMTTMTLKVCVLYYGGTLVTRGDVSSGDLVSFVLYELQFASSLEAVMRYYPEVMKAIGASEKIFEYLERKPKVPPNGTLAPKNLKGHIQLKNVSFSYSGKTDNLVLKDVSLEMKPGQVTALVGLNRSGKSTCVNLLERFYQPRTGEILLDGKPLQEYENQYLHDKIAVVSQDCKLFARSVRENIKYGYEDATDEEMEKAAKLARAHEFIMGLSSGYDTDAGENGGQVSGGQKQRIAIARALIRSPKILILDNATSDLDTENEYQVYQALLNQTNCSVLLISNKMSVVEKAKHIVVLNDGMVKEEGSHEELLERGGLYADLVRKQNLGFHRQEEERNDAH
ncbi:antigen peptide transporter 1 isoform X1 [Sebastes fasciatus]|uniref:antigen peptide transporter 1 isoform X1 n=2 Tax=Sebastes fasciatus TaxID=394691 RepID=UPI003D9F02EF